MALRSLCDGCGKVQDKKEKFQSFGFVKKGDYCPTCAKGVEEILRARDEVHEAIVSQWEYVLGMKVALWREKHPEGKLPDES